MAAYSLFRKKNNSIRQNLLSLYIAYVYTFPYVYIVYCMKSFYVHLLMYMFLLNI